MCREYSYKAIVINYQSKISRLIALMCSDAILPYLAVVRIIVIQDDLVAMGDSLTLMDTHLTLRGIYTAHGHLIQ